MQIMFNIGRNSVHRMKPVVTASFFSNWNCSQLYLHTHCCLLWNQETHKEIQPKLELLSSQQIVKVDYLFAGACTDSDHTSGSVHVTQIVTNFLRYHIFVLIASSYWQKCHCTSIEKALKVSAEIQVP